jgi:tripartite-type tricarboxylate transporter receptor subunit TctC
MRNVMRALVLAIIALSAVPAMTQAALAQSVADFYRGKILEITVGTGVGGGYDANARLVARHLGRFLPGNPAITVNNMPGGGGIRAANHLFHRAARDGSVIGTFSNAMITEPLLGSGQSMFEPAKFVWLGSASREDGLCLATPSSGVATWSDLLAKELIVGTTAPGTTTYMYPVMLTNLFGAKFRLVSGYPDGGQIALALQRGEVQAICQTWSSVKVGRPDWLRDRVVQPLITLGLSRNPDFPDLPAVVEVAKDAEQQQVLKVVLAPNLAGRPFVAPPGVPPERAEALRAAFDAMTHDAAFLAETHKMRVDVQPASGREIEALVNEIYALPDSVIVRTRQVVTGAGR